MMTEKRFQKTRIVDKWGGIYDSETDKVLNVNDVEHKLNEQQAVIEKLQRSKAYWKKQCKEWEKNWEDLAYEFARVNNMNKELLKDLED